MWLQTFSLFNQPLLLYRDDLIHPYLNGNKARKLDFLIHSPSGQYRKIISYGGNQSNMLFALSYLTKTKNIPFDYYTTPLSSSVKNLIQTSNYHFALSQYANIIELSREDYRRKTEELLGEQDHLIKQNILLIPQGGTMDQAKLGLCKLAKELLGLMEAHHQGYDVFIASGTGSSAYYLHQCLNEGKHNHNFHFDCYTVPCVGSEEYLIEQFNRLGSGSTYPKIITTAKKYHFGKCYPEFYELYKSMQKQNIEFELLYDMKSLLAIHQNYPIFKNPLIYIHCGGTYGNASMLLRYQRKIQTKI